MYIERLPLRNIWLREDDALGLHLTRVVVSRSILSCVSTVYLEATYQKIAQFNGGVGA